MRTSGSYLATIKNCRKEEKGVCEREREKEREGREMKEKEKKKERGWPVVLSIRLIYLKSQLFVVF